MTDDGYLDGGTAFSFEAVRKWSFYDYWNSGATPYLYQWEVNPNDGGSPEITKNMTFAAGVGPNRMNIVQEGQTTAPVIAFSGIILTQDHYEAMELWFDKRILIELIDDLNRQFYGVFSKWSPKRTRRARNPWYHTYSAEFTVTAYINASGKRVYGRIM